MVRISAGFLSGATHQDFLRINGNDQRHDRRLRDQLHLRFDDGRDGADRRRHVAEYKAAIELVTFSTSGDDPTAFGTDTSRTIAASVSDGLSMSDEIIAVVTVTGINDAPVNNGRHRSYSEPRIVANSITGIPSPTSTPIRRARTSSSPSGSGTAR